MAILSKEERKIVNARKKNILNNYETKISRNLDSFLNELDDFSKETSVWYSMYKEVVEENHRLYGNDEYKNLITPVDNYAGGMLERLAERLYLESKRPEFLKFLVKEGRFPREGEQYTTSKSA